jgi:CheY-like chemotaxis protein
MIRNGTKTAVRHKRILLIDDDEKFSDDLSFLIDSSYQIVSASGSKRGIELLEKERFDLVILDLNMPASYADEDDMEGIEVLRIIRQKWGTLRGSRIPVIIVSKMATPENRSRCEALGADAFFAKPPDIDDLKEMMERLVG